MKQSETDQASTSHQSQTSSDEFDDQSNENAQDSSMKVDSDPTARKRKIYDVKYRENWKIVSANMMYNIYLFPLFNNNLLR